MNLETENVTIDFSSNNNFCPDTTSGGGRVEVVSNGTSIYNQTYFGVWSELPISEPSVKSLCLRPYVRARFFIFFNVSVESQEGFFCES
jgi:hypothetical protein